MNEYYFSQIYDFSNEIHGFRFMTADDLEKLISVCGLEADVFSLAFCQNYFRERENRDPLLCELRFITQLIEKNKKKPSSLLLGSARSTTEVSDSFEDLISKLKHKKSDLYSFEDIADAASFYLKLAGKRTATPGIYGKCSDCGETELYAKGCKPEALLEFPSKGASCTLGVPAIPAYTHATAEESDFYAVVSPFSGDQRCFGEILLELLSDKKLSGAVKSASALSFGALPFLLNTAKGFLVDITVFPSFETNPTPSILLEEKNNVAIFLISGKHAAQFSSSAQALGLRYSNFGRPSNRPFASVRYGTGKPLLLNSDFLRNLVFKATLTAETGEVCAYKDAENTFTANGAVCETETAYETENIIFAASTTNSAAFSDTIKTVLSAISPIVAKGVDFSDISVSFDAKLPLLRFTEADTAKALELLSAKYRVQAELCLLSEGDRVEVSKDELSLSCFARARKPDITVHAEVTKNEGSLFVLGVKTSEDGIVDFTDLRNLYKFIVSAVRDGRAGAVRAVNGDGFEKSLKKMVGEATLSDFILPEELKKSEFAIFIVESDEELPGLKIDFQKVN